MPRELRFRVLLSLALAAVCSASHAEQTPPDDEKRYELRDQHDPNGIGKFYMGREIAQVMGHQGADWLERPEREEEEHPKQLVNLLKLKPGMNVADIGAGTGYITFPMAKKIAPEGKAYAVDIQPEMLDLLRQRMKKRKVTNLEPVQGTESDPKLPESTIDLIIMVDVYHEFSYPYEMTVGMVKALKPGGRLVFVEYRLEDPAVPIKLIHKMTEKQVIAEMKPHPLRWVGTIGNLPRQHVIIFEKNKETGEKGAAKKDS